MTAFPRGYIREEKWGSWVEQECVSFPWYPHSLGEREYGEWKRSSQEEREAVS